MSARDDFLNLITNQLYSQIYNTTPYNYLNAIFQNDKTAIYVYETNYLRANERITYWMGVYDSNPSLATSTFTSDLGTAIVDPAAAIQFPPTGVFGNVVTAPVQSDWSQSVNTSLDYIKNKPTIPSGQIQSDWTQANNALVDYIKNKPTLSTVATSGSYNDLSNKPTIPAAQVNSDWNAVSGVAQILNKPPSRSQSSASRSLNTIFQVSSTRDCLVNYSVDIATTLSLTTGQSGTVFLEIASDSGFTTNVQELARFVNGNTGTLTIGLSLTQNVTGTLTGYVPTAYYSRLRTANNTGTPTFTYRSGQEVLL